MQRLRLTLVLAITLSALFAAAALAADTETKNVTIEIPKPSLVAKFVPGAVLYPKLATPAFTAPGDVFELRLRAGINASKIIIDDGFGHSYALSYTKEGDVLKVKVPTDAVRGIYDLIIVTGSGQVIGEPHAVVVAGPNAYSKINIVHVTDRHFGVINSNGRSAANYDLAANFIVLGLPNNTIIIDTGDVADTARDIEYTESVWTDYLLDKPLIGIPGNHDHVGASSNYAKYRGPWNYTVSIYGLYRVVGIDSGGDGYITGSQASWAAKVLTDSKEPVKIVLFHHPHFTHVWGDIPHVFEAKSAEDLYQILVSKKPGSRYMYVYSSWLENKKAFKMLVEAMYSAPAKRVVALSGHVHLDSYAEVHRTDGSAINYVVTTATGGSVRPGDYHGFRIISLTSEGSIAIHGDGPHDARHASFNLEGVEAKIVHGPAAVSAVFSLKGTNVTRYMVKTVVAIPVPREYLGKKLELHLVNLDGYRLRCTPLGCTLYAYTDKPPAEGVEYKAILYQEPDEKPPALRLTRVYPPKPLEGKQVAITLKVSDDAWGVERLEAILVLPNGTRMALRPSAIGDTVRIIVPPLRGVEKAKLVVEAVDVCGKETVLEKEITYIKQAVTTTTEIVTQKPAETATTAATATTSPSSKSETPMTTKKTTATETTHSTTTRQHAAATPGQAAEASDATLTVALIIAGALAAFTAIVIRGRR